MLSFRERILVSWGKVESWRIIKTSPKRSVIDREVGRGEGRGGRVTRRDRQVVIGSAGQSPSSRRGGSLPRQTMALGLRIEK